MRSRNDSLLPLPRRRSEDGRLTNSDAHTSRFPAPHPLGVLHRADAAPEIEKCGHRYSLSAHPHFAAAATAAANRSLNASTAVLTSPLMASSRDFFVAIFFRIEG